MSDLPQHHLVTSRTLTRRNIEAAIAAATMPVHLVECDLEGVDLSRLDIGGFSFDRCSLIETDLSHASAVGTTWTSCRARKASLRGIDLTDATMRSGDWNNSDWQGATIASMRMTGAKLTGADFRGVRALGTVFEDCLMQSATLCGMSFRKAALGRCDMARADVRECDFRDAVFGEGSSLANAQIDSAKFQGADLREVDLAGHGIDALRILAGARVTMAQACSIVAGAGLRVG